MKKVLFATTALALSAGAAYADGHAGISASGSAQAGIVSDAGADFDVYSRVDLDFAMTGESDNGLSFGTTYQFNVGQGIDTDEGDFSLDTASTGSQGYANIYISGDFGKLSIEQDGIDNQRDDGFSHDIGYTYSTGGLSFGITADATGSGDGEEWSLDVAYDFGDTLPLAISIETDNGGAYEVKLTYTVSDQITAVLDHDVDAAGADNTDLKVSYDNGMYNAFVSASTDDNWEIGAGYAANGFAINAETDESDNWELYGSYDLGGGLKLRAGVNAAEFAYLGAAMSF